MALKEHVMVEDQRTEEEKGSIEKKTGGVASEEERSGSEELWWEAFSQDCESSDLSLGSWKSLKNEHPKSLLQEKVLLGLENYGQGQEPVRSSCSHKFLGAAMNRATDYFSGRLDEGLCRAIGRYDAAAKSGVQSGPYVICDYVPFSAFEAWYKHTESVWRIAFQYTDSIGGIALLYGDPSFLHEFISQWFGHVLSDTVTTIMGGEASRKYFRLLGSSRIILANGFHKEPDFIFQPRGWTSECAPVIGEVAYANEPLETLKAELILEAMQGYAKVAYGVKVTKKKDSADVRLRFLERSNGAFTRDIDFSVGVCTAPGDPAFLVPLPLSTMFEGCTTDERLLRSVVNFDLFELQQEVVDLLQKEYVWSSKAEQGNDKPLLGVKKNGKMKKDGKTKKQSKSKALFALVKSLVGW